MGKPQKVCIYSNAREVDALAGWGFLFVGTANEGFPSLPSDDDDDYRKPHVRILGVQPAFCRKGGGS